VSAARCVLRAALLVLCTPFQIAAQSEALANDPAAGADESPRTRTVTLVLQGCEGILSIEALSHALEIELESTRDALTAYFLRARPEARVRCGNEAVVVEVVSTEGVALEESIDAVHLGLARFVAIAVAESVWAHAADEPDRASPPPLVESHANPITESEPTPDGASGLSAALWLRSLGGAQIAGSPIWWSGEGTLGLELVVPPLVSLTLDATLGEGVLYVAPGMIEATHGTAALAVRLGGELERFRLDAGVGMRGGALVWSGSSTSLEVLGTQGTTPSLGALIDVRAAASLLSWLRIDLELEGGLTLFGSNATAFGVAVVHFDPGWLTARLGLAFRLAS
jgi:hypothetical protein